MASSIIADFKYDAARSVLCVWLTTGRTYEYVDVPPQVAEAFRFAASKGRYYNKYVRDRFEAVEITQPAPPKPSAEVIPFRKRQERP